MRLVEGAGKGPVQTVSLLKFASVGGSVPQRDILGIVTYQWLACGHLPNVRIFQILQPTCRLQGTGSQDRAGLCHRGNGGMV